MVLIPSIQPYPSNGTIIGLLKPCIHPKIDVPDLSQFVHKNLDTLSRICIHPLIAVLDVLEAQNFAGLLLVTIQTDLVWFGTDPGNF